MNELLHLTTQFAIDGSPVDIECLGGWHWHKTYVCRTTCEKKHRRYVLQQINKQKLPQPERVMENMVHITGHLQKKLYEQGIWDPHRHSLVVVPALDGRWCLSDESGRYWRMFRHVEDSIAVSAPATCEQIYQAALAYGEFLRQLADLPEGLLWDATPHLYNGRFWLNRLEQNVSQDTHDRAAQIVMELEQIREYAGIFKRFDYDREHKSLPMRITHNDSQINNVLLDTRTGERVCVIDLDAVAPGLAAYDFGNLVRTLVSDAAEEEPGLSKAVVKMERFESIVNGYLHGVAMMLTAAEKDSLIDGAKMMTLLAAVREANDFLDSIAESSPHHHNRHIQRCRTQLALYKSICSHEGQMAQVLERLSSVRNHKSK